MTKFSWFLRISTISAALLICFFAAVYFGAFGNLPSSKELKELKQSETTRILDDSGNLIGKYYVLDRQPVGFEQFPEHLVSALIATEDVRFYEHSGIDPRSTLRVIFKTLLGGDESSGGGSTLSMQLAKNIYGRKDRGALGMIITKFQEAVIAKRLEGVYSKDELLTLYLNTVPFSDNTFGIESASRKFFNKSTKDLELEEAAVLVGMFKATHSYNPRLFPEKSRTRRDVVLSQMQKYGFLSEEEAMAAKEKELLLDYRSFNHDKGPAPYFREQLRQDLTRILDTLRNSNGESFNLYRDGLVIHTTLNLEMQRLAEEAVYQHMSRLQESHNRSFGKNGPVIRDQKILIDAVKHTAHYERLKNQGLNDAEILKALDAEKRPVSMFSYTNQPVAEASTLDSIVHHLNVINSGFLALEASGAVKAWVGGVNFEYFKYDHISQSKRQVGSAFKPIVYTAALENGLIPCSYFPVGEITYEGGWTPSNSGHEEEDPYTNYNLTTALSKSVNTVAVKVFMNTGIDNVLSQAKKMGIHTPLPKVPSLALGTAELSLQELAGAYTSYINKGKPSQPFYLSRIEDRDGNILAEFHPNSARQPAFSESTGQLMIEMMKATVNEGTAARLRSTYRLSNDMAGKTGTTQSNKDGWFVGITPKLLTLSWAGFDDHRIGFRNTAIGQGANSALPVFALFMQKLNQRQQFNHITRAKFPELSPELAAMMDCEPETRDNFFERLFGKPDERRYAPPQENRKKRSFFKRLFGKN